MVNNINFIDKIKKGSDKSKPNPIRRFFGLHQDNTNWGLYLVFLLGIWMKFVCHNLDLGHDLGIFRQQSLELLVDEVSQVTKIISQVQYGLEK